MGAAGILHQILKLHTTASVLLIGAHPDDEDSLFMSKVSRGEHARVGYLSLTRGEGGQNAIGPELFEALGVIRTEELLQARTLDGGEQFFGREFDFGFSKTLEEASRMWGEREVIGDMVRAIRTFRPLVIYSLYGGTPADGHGHHQLAGRLAPLAFRAAADPAQYPEQVAEGLRPWQAMKLYKSTGYGPFGGGPGTTTRIDGGAVDPLLGRSYVEIAGEGRSQHKTQAMGTPEIHGPFASGLALLDSRVAVGPSETSVFDGIDTSLAGAASIAGLPAGSLKEELDAADRSVAGALDAYSPFAPEKSVQALAGVLSSIRNARIAARSLADASAAAEAEADFILGVKEREAIVALQGAAGISVDAVADSETAAPGESIAATVSVFLSHPALVKTIRASLEVPTGWRVETVTPGKPGPGSLPEIADRTDSFKVSVPVGASPSQPYWLRDVRKGQLFTWAADSPKGQPFDPPLAAAVVRLEIGGMPLTLTRPLQFRLVDPVRGELRRNVEVIPPLTVAFGTPFELVPLETRGKPHRVTVVVQSNAQHPNGGTLRLDLPDGWSSSPKESGFALNRKGERATITVMVTPAANAFTGRYTLSAAAIVQGTAYDQTMRTIAYGHIQTHRLYSSAQEQMLVLDLKAAPVRVGYIMGSGDQVPEALQRMGLNVTLLDETALSSGSLQDFDTIVVGVNASSARPDFEAALPRLYDYAKSGGTLIVQYQQREYVKRNLPPFPAQMASRVTDETAPVKILLPNHPLFTTPNRIAEDDFSDWVQERNLNAFTTFDRRYTPLLESHDPGEPPQIGGEVYAPLGKGHFVYTAYAWFRQLPAGVPGAYRMFANLVSLGARTK